jgi:hypothetical protein
VLTAWLSAFIFTQCVEMPIYAKLAKTDWSAAFGASALTHPVVWFVIPALWGSINVGRDSAFAGPSVNYWGMVAVAEAFAVVAEALYLGLGFKLKRAFAWSLLANASSAGLGLLSRWTFGWP